MQRIQLDDYKLFYDILNSASSSYDELKFTFSHDKFSLYSYGEGHTSLFCCTLDPSFFTEYQCDDEIEVCIFLTRLMQILKSTNMKGELDLTLIDNSYFDIHLQHEYEKNYKLLTIDYNPEELKQPEIKPDFIVTMKSNSLLELIKDVQYMSEDVKFETNENELKISGKGIYGDVNIKINESAPFVEEFSLSEPINNKYGIEFLYSLIKESSDCFDFCTLTIQNSGPLKINYNVFDMGTLVIYLAPIAY